MTTNLAIALAPLTDDARVSALLAQIPACENADEVEGIYRVLDTIPCWVNPDRAVDPPSPADVYRAMVRAGEILA